MAIIINGVAYPEKQKEFHHYEMISYNEVAIHNQSDCVGIREVLPGIFRILLFVNGILYRRGDYKFDEVQKFVIEYAPEYKSFLINWLTQICEMSRNYTSIEGELEWQT